MASSIGVQLAPPSGTDELDQLRFMIAQFAEAYPRSLKPRDPREFALKIKDQKARSNKENMAPAPRLRCYLFRGAPDQGISGYVALSESTVLGTPPTLKQIFVRKPERRKGLAAAALRNLPFTEDELLVEQPIKVTHLALESAGWRLVRPNVETWLYYRGVVAKSLPKVNLEDVWEWIESEAHGSSRASTLPISLPFYPAIVSRASLERATGEEGMLALLSMCAGQTSAPLFDLYDATAMLDAESASNGNVAREEVMKHLATLEEEHAARRAALEEAEAKVLECETSLAAEQALAEVRMEQALAVLDAKAGISKARAKAPRVRTTASGSAKRQPRGPRRWPGPLRAIQQEAQLRATSRAMDMASLKRDAIFLKRARVQAELSREVVHDDIESSSAGDPLFGVPVPTTPPRNAKRMKRLLGTPGRDEQMTPMAPDNYRSRKRKQASNDGLIGNEVDARDSISITSHNLVPVTEVWTDAKPRSVDLDVRVVQSDFIQIDLLLESRGIRVVSLSGQSMSGIRINDLITKVEGIAIHTKSKTRRRPPFRDGMAITIRRQLCW